MLAAGDPQCCCHGVRVKSGVEHHDSTVNATAQKVFSKLLDRRMERRSKSDFFDLLNLNLFDLILQAVLAE